MIINRNFFLLWQGLAVSSLGTVLFQMIGIIWLIEIAESASLVGLFLLTGGIFTAASTPLGGVLADRMSRRTMIVLVDLCNGATLLSLAVLFFITDSFSVRITCLFISQVILGINAGIFTPAVYALVPDLVLKEKLGVGNAIVATTIHVSLITSRGLSGFLFALCGAPLLILVTGVHFLISALSEVFIKLPNTNSKLMTAQPSTTLLASIAADVKHVVSYIQKDRGMAKAFLAVMAVAWYLGALMVSLPFLVQYHFTEHSAWYGYLLASLSPGSILGSIYAGIRFNQCEGIANRTDLLVVSLLAMPLLYLGLCFVNTIYAALSLCLLFGVFQGVTTTIVMTQIQSVSPNHLRGRVMSVFAMLNAVILPASSFAIGFLIDICDKDVVFVQCTTGVAGCVLVYRLLNNNALRSFISTTALKTHC